MRDIFIFFCLIGLVAVAIWRPWFMTFTYLYCDLIQPQRLSYYLFQGVPLSMILAILSVLLFLADRKKNLRVNAVQALMALFVVWFTFTSTQAIINDAQVWFKWDSAWKAVVFGGLFLPLVLSTRRRVEAAVCLFVLCVGLVTVSGAMKTLAGGGGYGDLKMIVDVNKGLYESSTIGAVGTAIIPMILYLYKHFALLGRNIWTKLAAAGLVASSVLIVIGTEARTGLVCLVALAGMYFVKARRKLVFAAAGAAVLAVSVPLLPDSFIDRMATILKPSEEVSAATRESVWGWAFDFSKKHPLGGGFRVNRLTAINVQLPVKTPDGQIKGYKSVPQLARAFHSSYVEVLAEQGYPGLLLYVGIIGGTLLQLGAMMRRYAKAGADEIWKHDLAQALFRALAVYAVGGLFVGLSTQTTLYMLVAISLAHLQVDASARAAVARASRRSAMGAAARRFAPAGALPA